MKMEDGTRPSNVSVIIPTFNREGMVMRAVESALEQEGVDVQLIVVDDGSTDGTAEVLRPLAETGRLVYLRHDRNRGASAARNTGLRAATGEFIAFLDSDDWFLPGRLLRHAQYLREHPEVQWVYSECWYQHAGRRRLGNIPPSGAGFIPALARGSDIPASMCVTCRRDFVLASGGFDESIPVIHDLDLYLRFALASPPAAIRGADAVRLEDGERLGHNMVAIYRDRRRSLQRHVPASHLTRRERADMRAHLTRLYHLEAYEHLAAGRRKEARRCAMAAFRRQPWRFKHLALWLRGWLPASWDAALRGVGERWRARA